MKLFSVIFYISTVVCLQAPYIYCSEITPAPKEQMIKTTCTTVCMPPTIDDLD